MFHCGSTGSIPVRFISSIRAFNLILIAQLAEHSIDNGEVGGSSPSQNIGNEQLQDVRVSLMKAKIVLAKQSERL